jgi:hypothetical protein
MLFKYHNVSSVSTSGIILQQERVSPLVDQFTRQKNVFCNSYPSYIIASLIYH